MAADPTCALGLIADDLTGAADTAVQFARRGWEALLILENARLKPSPTTAAVRLTAFAKASAVKEPDSTCSQVFAVATDVRALDHAAAEKLTADAVAKLVDAGIDRIYLKIDSTMRGSVPGQVAGALSIWRKKYPDALAVVCPAYPKMGRIVRANHLLVDGRPVEQSAIGRDPVTPVTTGDLGVLIPGSMCVKSPAKAGPYVQIVTVDAATDEDLAAIASAIDAAGPRVIPVGSAGLAEAMAARWDHLGGVRPSKAPARRGAENSRILIQVTSLNPASHAQVARLAHVFPDVVVLTGKAEQISATFAERVERERWDVLGLIGGDGARAALGRLGATAIRIVDALHEGIPFGFVVSGRADGMPLFTKAGGFGGEDALVRAVEILKGLKG
ncbi:MAG TPA: four-carbon acid sugar kinase family protein [Vicinamibacterales bacterium]|nr:four-carbon acid sugar kinase family protein [Vicinamibacterales bacterium]